MPINPSDPVYPTTTPDHHRGCGISIRTYIATAALQGMLANGREGMQGATLEFEAVQRADLLIAALNAPSSTP